MTRGCARASLIALVLVLTGAEARSACLSKPEARRAYPGAWLYWHGGDRGRRCWDNRRGRHQAQPVLLPVVADPRGVNQVHLVPQVAPALPAWEASPVDQAIDRLKGDVERVVYSTWWPNEPPLVWPQPSRVGNGSAGVITVSLAVITGCAVALLWGCRRRIAAWGRRAGRLAAGGRSRGS